MKKNILIIDDDLGTRSFLRYVLQKEFEVKACSDGYEAVRWLENGNFPDVIVSDMMMPRLHGLDFVKFIRSSGFFRGIPLVMLSGIGDDKLKNQAYKEGVNLYLQKPFEPTKLVNQIVNLLTNIHHAQFYRAEQVISR
uniref:Response regulator n=1 Tax=Roseihalotalea indica TaxID=2867963 RepID=A0AA49GLC4_9BACT|nr:response regulator [Tunicatimonas sp. TK19036]